MKVPLEIEHAVRTQMPSELKKERLGKLSGEHFAMASWCVHREGHCHVQTRASRGPGGSMCHTVAIAADQAPKQKSKNIKKENKEYKRETGDSLEKQMTSSKGRRA